MTVEEFVSRMRLRQALLFDSTATVLRRRDGVQMATTIYSGAVLIRPVPPSQQIDTGRTSIEQQQYLVKFGANTDVAIGDNITVTACPRDPSLVGASLRVIDVSRDEWQISRRVTAVDQVERPL